MFFKSKSRRLLQAEVVQIRDVTPHMRRITVIGDGLRDMDVTLPAQWVKMFVSTNGNQTAGRAYTIRDFDRAVGRMDIDIALHGEEGPASKWAINARPGECIDVAGPRGGYMIDASARRYTLIGDTTALPAIASIIQQLPASIEANAFVEVSDTHEEQPLKGPVQINAHWVHAGRRMPGTSGEIEAAVRAASLDAQGHRVWVAGESAMVRAVREHLVGERGFSRDAVRAAGYWKFGVADHRERD